MAKGNLIGAIAFLVGVLIAVIAGALDYLNGIAAIILVIIGLVVGFLNVGDKETTPFLLSAVSLVIVSSLGATGLSSVPIAVKILQALLMLFVPATIIVALKEVFSIAKD